MAQLAEQSLPTPEICGSNPDIDNEIFPGKTKIKKKRPVMVHLKNKQVMNRPQMATMAQDRGENLQKKLRRRFLQFFFLSFRV